MNSTPEDEEPNGTGVRITSLIVGSVIGVALIWVALQVTGWKWGSALALLLIYEGWTLVNRYRGDTISEVVWMLAKRPMVPWLFGLGTGYGIASGFLSDALLVLAVGFLSGHFFFNKFEE